MSPVALWQRFVDAVTRGEPATAVAWVRILVGVTVVYTLFWVWAGGLVDWLWLLPEDGGYRPKLDPNWLVRLLGGPTPRVVWGLFSVAFLSGLFVAIGLGGRWMALLCLQAFMAVTDLNSHAGGSYDELIDNSLWLLVVSPAFQTWSVDCRLRTGNWVDDTPRWAFARDLLVFQLVLMYATTGWQKLSADWTPGNGFSALYYILQQPTWHRFDMQWLAWVYPLTQVGTAVSWLWEVSAPLWLLAWTIEQDPARTGRFATLVRRSRLTLVYPVIGVIVHVGIHAFMDVGPFSLASLALYPALLHPHTVAWAQRWFPPVPLERSTATA